MIEERLYQEHHSILYYVDKNDPLGPAPENPGKDPQFEEWEKRIKEWAIKQTASSSASSTMFILATGTAPTAYDNVHTPENKPRVTIIKPASNEIITEAKISTDVLAESPRGISKVYYYINNNLFAEKSGYFFNLANTPLDFLNSGYHNLKVRACDDVNNCSESSVEINLVLHEESIKPEFTATITWPMSGLAVSPMDFPLNIKIEINNPRQVAQIELYYKMDGKDIFIGRVDPAGNEDVVVVWRRALENGNYPVYAKTFGWNGEVKETNTVNIILNR